MNSGPCNGPSKGASDCSGGTLNIPHRERGGGRERDWGEPAICIMFCLHLMDFLGQQRENNNLHIEHTHTHTHIRTQILWTASRGWKKKMKKLRNKKTIKIMPRLDACQWSKAYFTGRNLAVIPWQNSHLIYKAHNNPTQMSKRGIKRGEEKIISILIFFMPSSLRSRGPAV